MGGFTDDEERAFLSIKRICRLATSSGIGSSSRGGTCLLYTSPAVPVQVRLPDGTEGFFPRGGEIILP